MNRVVSLILLFPIVGLADDPFACVSPEVMAAFLPGYPEPNEYSTKLPEGFVEHSAPSSSRLIGSQVGRSHAVVFYAVDDDRSGAVDEITNSIIEQGWRDVGEQADRPQGGFQTALNSNQRQLCHDDGPRTLTVSSRESGTLGFVSISMHAGIGIQSCNELLDRSRYSHNPLALQKELPILNLPDGVRPGGQGSGGGGDEYDTHVAVVTDMPKESLVAVLNDQIRDQGWVLDASWSGSRSAGSAWAKESADGEPMIGMLTAYGGSDEAYMLRFEIRLDNAVARSGGPQIGIRLR